MAISTTCSKKLCFFISTVNLWLFLWHAVPSFVLYQYRKLWLFLRSFVLYQYSKLMGISTTCSKKLCFFISTVNLWLFLWHAVPSFVLYQYSKLMAISMTYTTKLCFMFVMICNINIVYGNLWELSRLSPETSTKLYDHEFGFRVV